MGDEDAVSPFRPGPNGIALPFPTALPTGSGLRTHREVHNETLGALVERTWTVSRTPIAASTHTHKSYIVGSQV